MITRIAGLDIFLIVVVIVHIVVVREFVVFIALYEYESSIDWCGN